MSASASDEAAARPGRGGASAASCRCWRRFCTTPMSAAFLKGTIYQGNSKKFCAPGLNCYSCPGAVAACPLGALQASLNSFPTALPLYMLGILLLFGALLGRAVCAFLCPFGLIQELTLDRVLKSSKRMLGRAA